MIMVNHITVKALLTPTHLYLGNHTGLRQNIEIPVNRSQTDLWHFFYNDPIQLISGHMLSAFLQFLKNYFTLAGHSYWLQFPLNFPLIVINIKDK